MEKSAPLSIFIMTAAAAVASWAPWSKACGSGDLEGLHLAPQRSLIVVTHLKDIGNANLPTLRCKFVDGCPFGIP